MSQEQLFEYAREGNLIKLGQMIVGEDLSATDTVDHAGHAAADQAKASGDARTLKRLTN